MFESKSLITIRLAERGDEDGIFELLLQMHDEIGVAKLSVKKVEDEIVDTIHDGWVFLLYSDNELVGTIGLQIMGYWYSDDKSIFDTWIYIVPEARSLPTFQVLINSAVEVGKHKGLPVVLCLQSLKDISRKEILFKRYMDQIMTAYRIEPFGGGFAAKGGNSNVL